MIIYLHFTIDAEEAAAKPTDNNLLKRKILISSNAVRQTMRQTKADAWFDAQIYCTTTKESSRLFSIGSGRVKDVRSRVSRHPRHAKTLYAKEYEFPSLFAPHALGVSPHPTVSFTG